MPSRNAQPIWNPELNQLIQDFKTSTTPVSLQEYLSTFRSWITSGTHSSLNGLDAFTHTSFTYGTTQSFDHFFIKHRHRRFRFFKGEFMYHQASLKHGFYYKYLDDEGLQSYDAVIISIPFSDSGTTPINLDKIFNKCNNLGVPVLIDLAYFPLSKNLHLNLNQKCIETITASLSKVFDGAQYLRAGIRFQRENIDDGIDVANSVAMVPHHTLAAACHLMNTYPIDYNWNTYEETYKNVCKQLKLKFTDCLMFGISFDNYKEYNRGNNWNRVCISEDIGKEYASTKSQ